MKKVEPSGVILRGVCSIQTERCTAKTEAPITAVWGPDHRVRCRLMCAACVLKKRCGSENGQWKAQGFCHTPEDHLLTIRATASRPCGVRE